MVRQPVLQPPLEGGGTVQVQEAPPGDLAIWFFIFAELAAFFALFVTYAAIRRKHLELFAAMQPSLNVTAGYLNTLLLVTGSWAVARSVASIKGNAARASARWLLLALGSGLGFLGVKGWEYYEKGIAGISMDTNLFFTLYFSLTLFHAMHVVWGLAILGFLCIKTYRGGYCADHHVGLETGAAYWHMVDLVWVVLFTLLYVIR